jgi:hypothetical protein
MYLSGRRDPDRSFRWPARATGTTKLSPKVRVESTAAEAFPPFRRPHQLFLSRPLLIEPAGLDNAPRIVAFDGNRVIVGDGGRAFVRGMGDSKTGVWSLYRQGNPLVDPDTNTTLGYEAIYLGSAKLVQSGDPATVELASVTQEVARLIPADQPEIVRYAPTLAAGSAGASCRFTAACIRLARPESFQSSQ